MRDEKPVGCFREGPRAELKTADLIMVIPGEGLGWAPFSADY